MEVERGKPGQYSETPHPPIARAVPIGLWVFSLVSDIGYRIISREGVWDEVALYTMVGGVVGALLAAIPGFIDFLFLSGGRVKRLALTHMVLNLTVVALYVVNVWLRMTSPPGGGTPFLLSIVAILLLSISGWLGGELVFRHGVAVDREPPMMA